MSVASPLRAVTLALILAALHCARAEAQEGKCPNATEAEARRLKSEIESLKQRGKWSEAIPQARCLFEVARKLFGPDHATTLNLQYDLAVITRAAGRTAEAAEIEKHADSATRPEKLRSDITDIEILVIQSKSFIDRGDRDEAGRICREARQLATSRDLMRHAIFAAVLNECGRVYELYGNYTMAEQRYLESASLARELGGSRDQQLGNV